MKRCEYEGINLKENETESRYEGIRLKEKGKDIKE